MVAHIVLITFGYAAMDSQRGVVGEAVHLVVDYPGMLLATAGSAALVMVVVTSIKKARAKLRYESWHLLHLYAYLGVGLALPHQLWTGADFLSHPLAAAFWWIAWCATAAAVVVYRVGLPLIRSTRHQLVVDRVVRESGDVVSVHLTGRPRRRERSAGGPATRDPRADRGAVRPTHRGRADSPRMSDADDPLFAEELRQLERRRPPSSTSNGSAGDYPSSGRSRIVKRIALWFSSTTTILMLLFGYHTSLSGAAVAASSGTSAAAGVVVIAPVTPTAAATVKTVNGAVVGTRYGDIQVQVVLMGSTIVKATTLTYSTNGRDGEINAYAIPALERETVQAGSARIDTVSGATYTSSGYTQSLQSALDAAHASSRSGVAGSG